MVLSGWLRWWTGWCKSVQLTGTDFCSRNMSDRIALNRFVDDDSNHLLFALWSAMVNERGNARIYDRCRGRGAHGCAYTQFTMERGAISAHAGCRLIILFEYWQTNWFKCFNGLFFVCVNSNCICLFLSILQVCRFYRMPISTISHQVRPITCSSFGAKMLAPPLQYADRPSGARDNRDLAVCVCVCGCEICIKFPYKYFA